jgi:hypothetical protein
MFDEPRFTMRHEAERPASSFQPHDADAVTICFTIIVGTLHVSRHACYRAFMPHMRRHRGQPLSPMPLPRRRRRRAAREPAAACCRRLIDAAGCAAATLLATL